MKKIVIRPPRQKSFYGGLPRSIPLLCNQTDRGCFSGWTKRDRQAPTDRERERERIRALPLCCWNPQSNRIESNQNGAVSDPEWISSACNLALSDWILIPIIYEFWFLKSHKWREFLCLVIKLLHLTAGQHSPFWFIFPFLFASIFHFLFFILYILSTWASFSHFVSLIHGIHRNLEFWGLWFEILNGNLHNLIYYDGLCLCYVSLSDYYWLW